MKTALVVIALLISSLLSAQDITQMELRLTNDSTEFYRIMTEISNTNPQDASGFVNRGIAYYHLRNYDQALSDFNKAIELDPAYSDAYMERGIYYMEVKIDSLLSVSDYNKALELDPQNASAYYNRGVLLSLIHISEPTRPY